MSHKSLFLICLFFDRIVELITYYTYIVSCDCSITEVITYCTHFETRLYQFILLKKSIRQKVEKFKITFT